MNRTSNSSGKPGADHLTRVAAVGQDETPLGMVGKDTSARRVDVDTPERPASLLETRQQRHGAAATSDAELEHGSARFPTKPWEMLPDVRGRSRDLLIPLRAARGETGIGAMLIGSAARCGRSRSGAMGDPLHDRRHSQQYSHYPGAPPRRSHPNRANEIRTPGCAPPPG